MPEHDALLGALTALPEEWDDMSEPPADLRSELHRERVVAAVRRQRRQARLPGLVGAAASAVLLTSGAYALGAGTEPAPGPASPVVEAVAVRSTAPGVTAEVGLVAHTWGTEVKLVADGLEPVPYAVTLTTRSGKQVLAGTFLGVQGKPVTCNLNGAALRPDVVAIRVADPTGASTVEVRP